MILNHPANEDYDLTSLKEVISGESVVAWVVPRAGVDLQEAEVISFVKEHTAPFKAPGKVNFLGAAEERGREDSEEGTAGSGRR